MAKNFISEEMYQKIEELNKLDTLNGATLADRIIKLSEECGEVAQAYLKSCALGSKSAENSNIMEECTDVLNVTLAILTELGVSDEEVKIMFEKKIEKWENKAKSRSK